LPLLFRGGQQEKEDDKAKDWMGHDYREKDKGKEKAYTSASPGVSPGE